MERQQSEQEIECQPFLLSFCVRLFIASFLLFSTLKDNERSVSVIQLFSSKKDIQRIEHLCHSLSSLLSLQTAYYSILVDRIFSFFVRVENDYTTTLLSMRGNTIHETCKDEKKRTHNLFKFLTTQSLPPQVTQREVKSVKEGYSLDYSLWVYSLFWEYFLFLFRILFFPKVFNYFQMRFIFQSTLLWYSFLVLSFSTSIQN